MSSVQGRMVPGFELLLSGFDLEGLERNEGSIFGLTADLRLGYLNPAWFRFAIENDGHGVIERWGLGACVLHAITDPLRPFFEESLMRCLTDRTPWQHDYDCSSPELYRRFHMDVYPFPDGAGLLVVNAVFVERPHDLTGRPAATPDDGPYLQPEGTILQCFHCRRVQRADGSRQWDWVPDYVRRMPENTTGGLCQPCYRVHYPMAPPMPDHE